ncbi:flagellar basal-body rod protein FlgB [Neorhodopirellula lusitana]|uniref:Flagellar basal-body rod protein FlgB n=1 Tax=Neorhodopirellula lusitana TaxID=445327 RepID=A0ABY1PNR7_9BACT|nr:flagellar biosynthesis protein FlgB [Neorhodopirellula lusitana]SMP39948.1 flagellar basal-body rod protein FlgB [Neorhodopirellula lusitana]
MFNPLAATTIGALEQTLSFTERRHELLAGNIANMSTPDYRSRDLDQGEFHAALADSIQNPQPSHNTSSNSLPLMPGYPAELQQQFGMLGHPALSGESSAIQGTQPLGPTESHTRDDRWSGPRAATEAIVFHDNSDVSLEEQVNQISKNKHLHNLAISTLRNQFELLRAAITERA